MVLPYFSVHSKNISPESQSAIVREFNEHLHTWIPILEVVQHPGEER